METVHIYHTNDLHSHLENWPRISSYLQQERNIQERKGEKVFSFDIGDACDRVHPLTEATDGKAIIRLLNEVGYDAATIGNNEGIGSTKKQLDSLYQHANFSVILSNMRDKHTGHYPEWASPFRIYKTHSGHKIGVIALTAPFPTSYGPIGWSVQEPEEVLPEVLELLSPEVDSIVLLSHLGIDADRSIAKMYPMIKIIMGSHTHHLLPQGEKVRETLITAAGKFGLYVGHIELKVEGNQILSAKASVQETAGIKAPRKEADVIEMYERTGHQILNGQEIGRIPETFSVRWQGSSELVEIGLEAVKDYAQTEASVLNAGLFMQPLLEGIVTNDDLHRVLPHPMRVLRCTLNGEDLERLIQEMEKNRDFLRNFPIKGMGFRGQIFGEICYNGITYNRQTKKVLWQNQPIEREKRYTFSTVDHFLYVPFFPTIELKGENKLLFPYFIRNVLGQYLTKFYPKDHTNERK